MMAYRGELMGTVIFAVSVCVWLVGWFLMLGGLSAGTSHNRAIGLGLDWLMVFFALVLVATFSLIQFRPALHAHLARVCYLFLSITASVYLFLGDKTVTIMQHIKFLGSYSGYAGYSCYAAYLSGIIISDSVIFVWLVVLNLEVNTLPARYFYGNTLSLSTKPADACKVAGSTPAPNGSVPVDDGKHDVEMARRVPTPVAAGALGDKIAVGADAKPTRAKAIFDYEKNKNDTHEISFRAGDILQVVSSSGKWWQCRRLDAQGKVIEEGYAPSNYLEKLGDD